MLGVLVRLKVGVNQLA
jgi:hypothetical protein